MKKLLPILVITLTSLLITKEVWSLPNCSGNYWNNCMGVFTFELDHPNWPGATYSGEWKNGKPDGNGNASYPAGTLYIGEFKNGLVHGQGTKTSPYGRKYVGEWKENSYNGQGTLTFPNGNKYVGKFMNGKSDGQGTMTFADGEKYVGEWKYDEREGQGTMTFADGEKYVGEWKYDERWGQGTMTYSNGDKYVGKFMNGKRDGEGTMTYSNGDKYVGEFKDGKKIRVLNIPDNAYKYGARWICNKGYIKSGNSCIKISNIANSYESNGIWYCDIGYEKSVYGVSCVKARSKKVSSKKTSSDDLFKNIVTLLSIFGDAASSATENLPSPSYNSVTPSFNSNSNNSSGYKSSFGNTYQYDLSNPLDRVKYNSDPRAKLRDRTSNQYIKELESNLGQSGGGIFKKNNSPSWNNLAPSVPSWNGVNWVN